MKLGKIGDILIRYIITLILGVFLFVFYIILTPTTIYPVYWLLSLFYDVVLAGNSLIIQTATITLIPACIAGSAYYLLLILNLLTPMKLETRIKGIVFSFLALLVLNIARITLFSSLFATGFKYFDLTHLFFWYVLSIIFVFLIWIAEIKIYKIKDTPICTDIRYLLSLRKNKKPTRQTKEAEKKTLRTKR